MPARLNTQIDYADFDLAKVRARMSQEALDTRLNLPEIAQVRLFESCRAVLKISGLSISKSPERNS